MGATKWFEELLNKADTSDLNIDLDEFSVKIHKGDKVFAEWDITDELRETGLAFRNYTNKTLNLDAQFLFMHNDLQKQLKDEEALQNFLNAAMNSSIKEQFNISTSMWSDPSEGVGTAQYTQAVAFLLLGMIGLFVKQTKSQKEIVRVTRRSISFWCILVGILMALTTISEKQVYKKFLVHQVARVIFAALNSISMTITKIVMVSLKLFTATIYAFQNIMIYKPFYFREHSEFLTRWFVRVSVGQLLTLSTGLLTWALLMVFHFQDCRVQVDMAHAWKITLIGLASFGYLISFLLSFTFLIGRWKACIEDLGQSQRKTINKTLISCSIEILFDFMVLLAIVFYSSEVTCFRFDSKLFLSMKQAPYLNMECDLQTKLHSLDMGVSGCAVHILIVQPFVQESYITFSEIYDRCTSKPT